MARTTGRTTNVPPAVPPHALPKRRLLSQRSAYERLRESYRQIVDKRTQLPPACFMDSTSEIMIVLRAGRSLLGLSQDELAGLAGVSRQVVARIERGENNILVDAIAKVRAALEARGAVFIDGTAERGPGVSLSRIVPPVERS